MALLSPADWAASRKPECVNCIFFNRWEETPRGECRKNPPVAGEMPRFGSPQGVWPQVDVGDFCGEWRRRPEPEGD